MQKLTVELGERSYPIFIGRQLFGSSRCLQSLEGCKQVLIVSNSVVAPLYAGKIKNCLAELASPPEQIEFAVLPDGEKHKNLATLNQIFDQLLENRFDRKAQIIALGGGVIGDMAGFAAACYQRGINFVQVPTTLLSQVDSSVGGKTGVNHKLGKNMIGAFYQPQAVIIDTSTLETLPDREIAAGIAEIIKYGLIYDAEFFQWLENNLTKLIEKDAESLAYAIRRSCEIKARVVAEDEKESGLRAILNLGHTYGHAIENQLGYGEWLHGEAVAAGMVMACDLSVELGWLGKDILERAQTLIAAANLPTRPPTSMTAEQFVTAMSVDKKVSGGKLRLVLLKGCGNAVVTSDFDHALFKSRLAAFTQS